MIQVASLAPGVACAHNFHQTILAYGLVCIGLICPIEVVKAEVDQTSDLKVAVTSLNATLFTQLSATIRLEATSSTAS